MTRAYDTMSSASEHRCADLSFTARPRGRRAPLLILKAASALTRIARFEVISVVQLDFQVGHSGGEALADEDLVQGQHGQDALAQLRRRAVGVVLRR